MKPLKLTCAALLAGALPGALHAQEVPRPRTGPDAAPPPLPPYSQPNSLPDQAAPPTAAPAIAGEGTIDDVAVAGDAGGAAPPSGWTPPSADGSGFKLVHDEGQRLDTAWVRRQFEVNGLIGAAAPVERALALVQLLNRAFLSAGFVNSGVVLTPGGSIADGTLDLSLILGRLVASPGAEAPVTVEWGPGGARGLDAGYVIERMPSAALQPLSAPAIERDFRLLAEDPAIRTINADLRPGSRPGEASLHLIVTPQDRFDLYLSAANSRSPSVGGERLAGGAFVRNLLASGDLLSGEAGVTEGLTDATIGYSTPFLTPRTTLSIRGSLNNAAVTDAPLVPLDIESRDRAGEIGITHRLLETPLLPSATPGGWHPARSLSAGLLLAHRRSKTFLLGEPFSFSPGSVDGRSEYTALRLIGDFVLRNVDQVVAVSATGTLGLGGTRSDVPGILNPSRNFTSLLVQLNYARRLTRSGLELRARLAGQYTEGTLYSGERLSAGGEASVRGYRENLLLADRGIIGSVELSHPFDLTRDDRGRFDWGAFTLSAFADAAYVDNAKGPDPSVQTIAGLGLALAWTPSEALSARIAWAEDLKEVQVSGSRDLQDRGFHFRLTLRPLKLFR